MTRNDRRLIERMRRGDPAALRQIYLTYKDDLLTVGACLLGDVRAAEDVLHDVFVRFAENSDGLRLRSSLKAYLATCMANRARDRLRKACRQDVPIDSAADASGNLSEPVDQLVRREDTELLYRALATLPYEQREAITLHLHGGLKFRQIAEDLGVSINTIQSRYRYGLEKLRSLLGSGETT